jgi:hypothetical protein
MEGVRVVIAESNAGVDAVELLYTALGAVGLVLSLSSAEVRFWM